jgi:PAS domain S-box-containing protein
MFYVAERERRAFTAYLHQLTQQAEGPLQWEMWLHPPRAVPVCVLVTAAPSLSNDRPSGLRWTLQDITRRKQGEEELRAEKEFADSLFEMAEAVTLVLDHTGRIVRLNSYLCTLIGSRRSELVGRAFTNLLVPEDQPSAQQALDQLANGGTHAHGVHCLHTADGRTRTLAWSARILAAGSSGNESILFVGNDVTDLQEAQQRALQAERLAAIGQMSAGLAHECRNALQRSQSCLAVLALRLEGHPDLLELLDKVQQAQDDLHRQFEDVRAYASPIHLELRRCNLATVWRQAWEDLAVVREDKGSFLLVEETVGVDLECLASPFHLRQVFRNLFENALVAGGAVPCVTVHATPTAIDGHSAIEVAIQDNGPGFAEEERRRAFEVFFTTKVRGTGLGLAICKRIIEAHGGRIAVGESATPGAVLLLTVPRRPI